MPPESMSTVRDTKTKFREVAADAQKSKWEGQIFLFIVGYFNSRIGKASNRNVNIVLHQHVYTYQVFMLLVGMKLMYFFKCLEEKLYTRYTTRN